MIIIGLVTGLIFGLIIIIKNSINWDWKWINIPIVFITSAIGTLSGVLLSLFIAALGSEIPMIPVGEPIKTELIALEDGNGIHGNFYLGFGYIESNQYYYYLTETPKGITQSKININDNKAYLRPEDFEGTPYLITQKYRCGNGFIYFLSNGLLETTEYYFYIPPDSITYSYNIDLK